ncbi:MAG: hypothetical protein AAB340_02870 [Patescibacteria group bacterium]
MTNERYQDIKKIMYEYQVKFGVNDDNVAKSLIWMLAAGFDENDKMHKHFQMETELGVEEINEFAEIRRSEVNEKDDGPFELCPSCGYLTNLNFHTYCGMCRRALFPRNVELLAGREEGDCCDHDGEKNMGLVFCTSCGKKL